jgi:uroporphyrinogen-III decarboxylase
MWVYTHTEEVRAFLELLSERIVAIYRQFLEQGIGEVFWISGPEYLCPPFASPEVFHHLGIFYDKPLFDLIRSYGKQTILHCHGLIYDVLDSIAELDPSGLHPIEPHPIGDCHLSDARKRLGEEMVLIGNIEYSNLETKAPTEIEHEVKRAIEEGGPGRFILSPSCTPFADSITPQVADNYVAMINAGLEYGKLS